VIGIIFTDTVSFSPTHTNNDIYRYWYYVFLIILTDTDTNTDPVFFSLTDTDTQKNTDIYRYLSRIYPKPSIIIPQTDLFLIASLPCYNEVFLV